MKYGALYRCSERDQSREDTLRRHAVRYRRLLQDCRRRLEEEREAREAAEARGAEKARISPPGIDARSRDGAAAPPSASRAATRVKGTALNAAGSFRRSKGATMQARDLLITDADHRRLASLVARLRASGRSRFDHIAALTHRMRAARLVSPADVPGDVVTLNSRVILRDLDSGERLHCTLADPHDVTMFGDRLSVAGPAGMALLGKRAGRVVRWRLGSRVRRLRIERILYQPEAAGDYHL